MSSKIRSNRAAFTLVEIMIVVAIIGLLAALAIPGFVKARKQSQGRRILNDARQIDAAIDQWALENGKKDGDAVVTLSAATYLKTAWPTNDLLGANINGLTIGDLLWNGRMECSTCHDVHNTKNEGIKFTLVKDTQSNFCFTCHMK